MISHTGGDACIRYETPEDGLPGRSADLLTKLGVLPVIVAELALIREILERQEAETVRFNRLMERISTDGGDG